MMDVIDLPRHPIMICQEEEEEEEKSNKKIKKETAKIKMIDHVVPSVIQ